MNDKNLKQIFETARNPIVMMLSAGIIKPEHDYSGEADRRAIIELTDGKFDIGQNEWKQKYEEIFLKRFKTDWPQMYVAIVKEMTGKDINRGIAIATYIPIVSNIIKEKGVEFSIIPRVRESLGLMNGYGSKIGLISGQETVILYQYISGFDYLCDYIDPRYVQGGIIPSTADNVRDRAYGIIKTIKTEVPESDTLILLDGNRERLEGAGTKGWKEDLDLPNIIKVGIKDDWISKKLGEVTDFQYNSMLELYNAIK